MSEAPKIGLYGLAVMGQNLALNIAEHGFPIAVCNRSPSKVRNVFMIWTEYLNNNYYNYSFFVQFRSLQVDDAVKRAQEEGNLPLIGYKDVSIIFQHENIPARI
jgi:6-phosphogluconate dehydrogenase